MATQPSFKISAITLILAFFIATFAVIAPVHADEGISLIIPAIEVNAPVVTIHIKAFPNGEVTWDTSSLNMTVGYMEGTAWFGQSGNTVLGGHSELARGQGDVFYKLDQVQVGNEIIVTANGSELRYTVHTIYSVSQDDLTPIFPTSNEQLTLITCDLGSFDASNGTYHGRLVVVAGRTG